MTEYLDAALHLVHENQHLAYLIVGILSFSESLPVLGSIIPGTTMIMAISALVASGAVHLWPLLGSAILGAIGGDGFSYWLGRRYHREITLMWPLSRYPQIISLGEAAFAKHGGKSIFIARFTPAIRAIVPLVAGILRMDPLRFYVVNIISAIAWAPFHILPAVLAGASLTLFGAVAGRLLVLVVLLLLLLSLVFLLARYALLRVLPWASGVLVRLWRWASERDSWISREVLSLLDPRHQETQVLALLALFLVFGLWTFFALLSETIGTAPLSLADSAVFNYLQNLRTAWSDQAMVVVNELGDQAVTVAVAIAVLLWLVARRAWHTALYWLGAVGAALIFLLTFTLLQKLRPETPPGMPEAMIAPPSGHTALDLTVYGFLALLVGRELGARGRLVLAILVGLLVSFTAFSRIYLGTRWISDMAGGLGFGLAWTAMLGIAYIAHRPQRIGARQLLAVAGIVFLVAGGVHVAMAYPRDVHRYVATPKTIRIGAEAWWRDEWQSLPARRIDLRGQLEDPLALQWAGPLEGLKDHLLARGWQEPPPWSVASTLTWLQSGLDPSELPVLTQLHDGLPAQLILIHPEADHPNYRSRLILRVWQSNVMLKDGGRDDRVWLGAVVQQRLYRVASLMTLAFAHRDLDAPRPLVVNSFAPGRLVFRAAQSKSFGWDGWVMLTHDPSLELPDVAAPAPP